jgi:hypothetical protein
MAVRAILPLVIVSGKGAAAAPSPPLSEDTTMPTTATDDGGDADPIDLHPGGRFQGGEEYLVRLRARPSTVPPLARVKQLLRAARRTNGLRCRSVHDVTPRPPDVPPARHADGGAGCGDR